LNTSKWINTQLLKNMSINSRKKDFLTNQHNRQLKFEHKKKKSSKKNITELKEIEPRLAKKRSSSAKINKIKFDHLLESNKPSIHLQSSNYYIQGDISLSKEEFSNRSNKKKHAKEGLAHNRFSKALQKKGSKMNGCISPNMVMKSINKEEYKSIFITNKSFKKSKNQRYKTFISKENQDGPLLTLNDKAAKLNDRSSSSSPKQVSTPY
jgi:hypothetical protein